MSRVEWKDMRDIQTQKVPAKCYVFARRTPPKQRCDQLTTSSRVLTIVVEIPMRECLKFERKSMMGCYEDLWGINTSHSPTAFLLITPCAADIIDKHDWRVHVTASSAPTSQNLFRLWRCVRSHMPAFRLLKTRDGSMHGFPKYLIPNHQRPWESEPLCSLQRDSHPNLNKTSCHKNMVECLLSSLQMQKCHHTGIWDSRNERS